MDALMAIASRYSTREFSINPVARETLERIIDAGQQAPTARNEQPWDFVVVTKEEIRQQIAGLTDHGKFMAQAPAVVCVFCRDTKYYLEDGCAATENILLAATALGVQSCWVAGDKKPYGRQIMQLLGVPEGYRLVSLIALGYAASPGHPKTRRGLKQVLHWERFSASGGGAGGLDA